MLWVALGGALGAATRYGIGEAVRVFTAWPGWIAVFVANAIGTLLLGVVLAIDAGLPADGIAVQGRALLAVGYCGALTTFSAFGLDTAILWHARSRGLALVNVAGSIALGAALLEIVAWRVGGAS